MGHYLLVIVGLCLSAIIYWGSERRARGVFFHIFWISGVLLILLSFYFYQSITLFDQDLKPFPLYQKTILIGFFSLIISRIMAVIFGKSAVYAELAEERQQRAISEITQLAASSGSLMELLNFSLDKIISILKMSAGAAHIFHAARQNLVLGSYIGLSARMARRLETLGLDDTAIGRTARNRRLLIIRNLRLSHDYEIFGGRTEGFTHMALIPIVSNGQHWGVITLFGRGPYRPGKLRVDLLEQFGEQLGAALVFGRKMRFTANSLENSRAFLGSLGDELYVTSRLVGTGQGAIRGITWTLARILGGDRFDLVEKSGDVWQIVLSSEPDAAGRKLNLDDQLDVDIETAPSGLINWNQNPPFKEFAERRSYAFCAMPDKTAILFIRMESRRSPAVDFEFFYNACKIIQGLSLRLLDTEKPGKKPGAVRPRSVTVKRSAETSGVLDQISEKFEKIGGDLDKLIDDYSDFDGEPGMKSLISWLETIKQSADEGKDVARIFSVPAEERSAVKPSSRPKKTAQKAVTGENAGTEMATRKKVLRETKPIRILAVDSQDVIRELLTSMLTGMGYDATVVSESKEAIGEFRKAADENSKYEIVVADNVLDTISGLELSSKLKEIDPGMGFILISGWGQEPEQTEIDSSGVDRVLRKPFRIEQLSEVIGDLLREHSSA
jgi:CheY-like chemotaxis protein